MDFASAMSGRIQKWIKLSSDKKHGGKERLLDENILKSFGPEVEKETTDGARVQRVGTGLNED